MIALITTTINIPKVLSLYARLDSEMLIIVAADRKTPPEAESWVYENCKPKSRVQYMTVEQQQDLGYSHSELIGYDTDSRRNIALLEAVKAKADIILSVDDDMIPLGEDFIYNIERVLSQPYSGLCLGDIGKWFDAGHYTIPKARQRGLPVDAEIVNQAYSCVAGMEVGAVQGIILGVPDSDAPTAIADHPIITSVTDVLRNGFVVHPEALSVFNSQITAFRRELAPAFAQFYKWQGRNTDILASLITRKIMKERGLYTFFGPPTAFHARSKRPLFNDLKAEMYGLEKIEGFQRCLDALWLAASSPVVEQVRQIHGHYLTLSGETELKEAACAFCDDMESVL